MSAQLDRLGLIFVAILVVAAILVPLMSLAVSPGSAFYLPPYLVQLLGKIALLIFIILFIQKRPRGLFALKGRAVEA